MPEDFKKRWGYHLASNGDSGLVLRQYHTGMDREIGFSSELKEKPLRVLVQESNII